MQFPTFRFYLCSFPIRLFIASCCCCCCCFTFSSGLCSFHFAKCFVVIHSHTYAVPLCAHRTPIAKAFVDSSMQLNYSHVNLNSGDQIGVSYLQASTKNGWRQTAAKAFLSRFKDRPNLDISLRSWATKLLFNADHDHVKGVKFYRNRQEFNVKVRKEVIVSAGAFQSPKLLMLSGIGPADHLNEMHIDLVKVLYISHIRPF